MISIWGLIILAIPLSHALCPNYLELQNLNVDGFKFYCEFSPCSSRHDSKSEGWLGDQIELSFEIYTRKKLQKIWYYLWCYPSNSTGTNSTLLTPRGNRMVLDWNQVFLSFSQEKRKDINGNFCSLIIRYHRVLAAGLWDFLVTLQVIVYIQRPEYSGTSWSNFSHKGFEYSKKLFGFQSLSHQTFSLPSNSAESRIIV